MKIIISIAIGVVVFFGMGKLTYAIFHIDSLAWLVAISFGILAIVISFKKLGGTSVKETIADAVSYIKTTGEGISALVDDKDSEFYAIAEQEIKDGAINNGLWSQALIKAKGDEKLRKVEYMKLRVKQLKKKV